MADITNKVVVISSDEIELSESCEKGDSIKLKNLNKVDLSPIQKLIDQKKDLEYEKRLKSIKEDLEKIHEKEIIIKTQDLENKLANLESKME